MGEFRDGGTEDEVDNIGWITGGNRRRNLFSRPADVGIFDRDIRIQLVELRGHVFQGCRVGWATPLMPELEFDFIPLHEQLWVGDIWTEQRGCPAYCAHSQELATADSLYAIK